MIELRESFWHPIGWVGWVRINPTERIRFDGKWSNQRQVRWIYVRKVNHIDYHAIAEVKIKIWVDEWRCLVGNKPCTRCKKLEDCVY